MLTTTTHPMPGVIGAITLKLAASGVPIFMVTKSHTGGVLAGLETTEYTTVAWELGDSVSDGLGGGSYTITAVTPVA